MIAAKITQEEKDSTKATVDEDRKHAIEAAIVRIMKTRKTLDHQKLVLEASNQLLRCAREHKNGMAKRRHQMHQQPQLHDPLLCRLFLRSQTLQARS